MHQKQPPPNVATACPGAGCWAGQASAWARSAAASRLRRRLMFDSSEESNMRLLRSLLAAALLAHALACPAQQPAPGQAVATFGGGCFWCMEPPYDALPGVISTTSGYMGG